MSRIFLKSAFGCLAYGSRVGKKTGKTNTGKRPVTKTGTTGMGMLIKGAFWFSLVLVCLPFFDSEAEKNLSGAPQVEATQAFSAAAGAIGYISQMCAQRPDVCQQGSQTIAALGSRAREGALVAYKMLDKNFGNNPAATASTTASAQPTAPGATDKVAALIAAATKDVPETASQPMPDKVTTGTIIPIPQARPQH